MKLVIVGTSLYLYSLMIEALYQLYRQHSDIQTDTRKLKPGEFYFALKGENFDGNKFAEAALQMGAAYAVIDDKQYYTGERTVLVDDVLETLQQLAAYHRQQFTIPFIAVTGSNGKTTTKELLFATLNSRYKTYATQGNLNNHIGVPLTLLKIRPDAEMAIIEMGANHLKEIESYCRVAQPTHGLINNCGKAHLEGFGGVEGVRRGKGELYDFIRAKQGAVFINNDLPYLREMAAGISNQISYGSADAQYFGRIYENDPFLSVAVLSARNECLIKTQLVGEYNFANVMAAVAVGRTFDIPIDTIKEAIERYAPDNSRSQLVKRGSNTIIMDAYNANPSSMQVAIQNFARSAYANKVIILGAMMELGEDSIAEHQQVISLLQQFPWRQVVLVGGDFQHTKHPWLFFDDAPAAGQWLKDANFEDTAILVKGSRSFAMERVLL